MNKLFMSSLFLTALLATELPQLPFADNQKIAFQNSILCKVNGKTLSMMDVKKRMDLLFHQNYPQLSSSNSALYQFYVSSWQQVLLEMIDQELILADAADKEIKLTDGEVREELESRFGPNVMITLDKIGVTYEEAWKMTRNDLIVARMSWWFIQSRALQSVTPQKIRQAYRSYLKEHPPYEEWHYRVLSLRGKELEERADQLYGYLTNRKEDPEALLKTLKEIAPSLHLSSEYVAKDCDLSEVHRRTLASLSEGQYSPPVIQISRADRQTVGRIFYLEKKREALSPSFEEIAPTLQNELTQKAIISESRNYLEKLRNYYGFDNAYLKETLSQEVQPFSLE